MRIRTVIPAIAAGAVMVFSSAALAARDRDAGVTVRSYQMDDADRGRTTGWDERDRWDRGDWTAERRTTVRTRTYGVDTRHGRPMAGIPGDRQFSGPYRYFYTDHEGKYNYFLDRYGYPYAQGGVETHRPADVFGYAPPEVIGGGPVRYYRDQTPLSRSPFDR
jgi:hypothetical protein